MSDVLGRRVIAEALAATGVGTVFTVPGGHFLPTYHEIGRLGRPKVVVARHEQGAGYMASGYALATGECGVVLAGAPGPGVTNLITAVANAQAESTPLLVLTAQVDRRYVHRNILQYCESASLLEPFCKRSVQAASLEEIPNLVATGVQLARSGRPGVVHISIPQNLQAERIASLHSIEPVPPLPAAPPSECVAELVRRLEASQRPAILAGHGVLRSNGTAALADLAQQLGAPVATSRSGIGSINTDNPHSVGMLGFYGPATARHAIASADVVLIAGCALGEQTTLGWRDDLFASDASVIQIDVNPSEINRVYKVDQGIIASAAETLAAVCHSLGGQESAREPWYSERPVRSTPQNDSSRGLSAAEVIDAVNRLAPADVVVSADIGNHRLWVCEQLDIARPEGLLQSCEFDAMGFSLPAAIGAAVGLPDTSVVSISGDGGIVHTMGELAVARDHNVNVVAIVFVDGALGILRHQAEGMFGEEHFVGLGDIDFGAVAAGFGVDSRTVSDLEDLDDSVSWALGLKAPALLAVKIDPEEVFPPLLTKIEQRKIDLMQQYG